MYPDYRREQLDEDIKRAASGGKRDHPLGFYFGLCCALSVYLGIRTDIGLPGILAPVSELKIIRNILVVVTLASSVAFVGVIASFVVQAKWPPRSIITLRYGKNGKRQRNVAPAVFLAILAFELFIGLLYLLEWLWGKVM